MDMHDAGASSFDANFTERVVLQQGRHSTVVSAWHLATSTPVVIKTYSKATLKPHQLQSVYREIRLLRACQAARCEGVVTLLTACEPDDASVHLVFRACLRGDLYQLLQKEPNQQLSEHLVATTVVLPLLITLAELHGMGIVHRDVKPENLFLDLEGRLLLGDFGLAAESSDALTERVGTLDYMAPEVLSMPTPGELAAGHTSVPHLAYCEKVDVWAVGCLCSELLTGQPPFEVQDPKETAKLIVAGKPAPLPPHLSMACVDFVRQALTYDPSQRPSALHLLEHPWLTHNARRHLHVSSASCGADGCAAAAAYTPAAALLNLSAPSTPAPSGPGGPLAGPAEDAFCGGDPRPAEDEEALSLAARLAQPHALLDLRARWDVASSLELLQLHEQQQRRAAAAAAAAAALAQAANAARHQQQILPACTLPWAAPAAQGAQPSAVAPCAKLPEVSALRVPSGAMRHLPPAPDLSETSSYEEPQLAGAGGSLLTTQELASPASPGQEGGGHGLGSARLGSSNGGADGWSVAAQPAQKRRASSGTSEYMAYATPRCGSPEGVAPRASSMTAAPAGLLALSAAAADAPAVPERSAASFCCGQGARAAALTSPRAAGAGGEGGGLVPVYMSWQASAPSGGKKVVPGKSRFAAR